MPEETQEDLEKQKLTAEIKNLNRLPFKTPVFWAPVFTAFIAFTTYLFFWQSGFFDMKMAHIQYVTDTLNLRAKTLGTSVRAQEIRAKKLQYENDSLKKVDKQLADKNQAADSALQILRSSLSDQGRKFEKLFLENSNLKSDKSNLQNQITQKQNGYIDRDNAISKLTQENNTLHDKISSMRLKISDFAFHFNVYENEVKKDPNTAGIAWIKRELGWLVESAKKDEPN